VVGGANTHHRYVDPLHNLSTVYRGKSRYDFGSKGGEQVLTELMKEKFKLVNKPSGYTISNICNLVMKVVMQILAQKVMRKCHVDEVLAPIVALAH